MDMEEYGLLPPDIVREEIIGLIISYMVRANILQNPAEYLAKLHRCNDIMLAYELINSKAKFHHYLEADALGRLN